MRSYHVSNLGRKKESKYHCLIYMQLTDMQLAFHKFTSRLQANNFSTLILKALTCSETDTDVGTHAVVFILWCVSE